MNTITFISAPVNRTESGYGQRIRLWIKTLFATFLRRQNSCRMNGQLSQLNGNLLRDIGKSRIEADFLARPQQALPQLPANHTVR